MALNREVFYFGFALFFIAVQLPSGSWAGLEYSQSFPGGEFAVCETCRLGRGKCRRVCLDNEKIAGKCKLNFFCCRERI
ncbi:beta-defensin 12 [Phodopus roborovskii]|uniref:Beta-defensin n=1 Tax=Phodopus roborovskii TaxID=109678 RepID=A0AAU9Z3E7_PHORO|nr:beta-defensin 12 [Phodopus roborovskii]CAH6787109.1 Defb12 [Phodopus roborovskii]